LELEVVGESPHAHGKEEFWLEWAQLEWLGLLPIEVMKRLD